MKRKSNKLISMRKPNSSPVGEGRHSTEEKFSVEAVSVFASCMKPSNDNVELQEPSSIVSSEHTPMSTRCVSPHACSEQSSIYTRDGQDSIWILESSKTPCPSPSSAIDIALSCLNLEVSNSSYSSDSSSSSIILSPPNSIRNISIPSILRRHLDTATTAVSSRCNATGTKSSSENSNASSTYSQDDAWDISFYADPHVNPEYDPTAPVDAWDQYLAHISNIKDRESMFQLPPIASRPCPTKRTVAQRNHESPIPSPHQPPPPSALKPKPIKTVEEVTMRWKIMRSPFSAHLHNYFCPFWQHGDRRGFTRSQCPKDETFNLFHVNPFTKSGRAHREWLDRRDAGERMRREYEKGCDEEVVGEASSALPET